MYLLYKLIIGNVLKYSKLYWPKNTHFISIYEPSILLKKSTEMEIKKLNISTTKIKKKNN